MRLYYRLCLMCLAVLVASIYITPNAVHAQGGHPAMQPCKPSAKPMVAQAPEQPAQAPAMPQAPLNVVTTVAPLTNVVFNIGGSRIKLYGLIPEGADSHTFEPKPSAAQFLSKADIVFVNGLNLEIPTVKLAQANLKQGAEIVTFGDQTLTKEEWVFDFSFPKDKGDPNPHLWMNPLLTLNYAKIARDTLTKRDPDGKAYYAANYDKFAERIAVLDQAICDTVTTIPAKNRKLLTYHDSFAYFAPRYGMTVIGAIQPADFAEPSAKEVANLIEQLKKEGVPAIFGSEVFSSKVLDQIGKEAGVKYIETLADDDLPNQIGDRVYHSYLQLMVNDVKTMTDVLGGDSSPLKVVNAANLHGSDAAVDNAKD